MLGDGILPDASPSVACPTSGPNHSPQLYEAASGCATRLPRETSQCDVKNAGVRGEISWSDVRERFSFSGEERTNSVKSLLQLLARYRPRFPRPAMSDLDHEVTADDTNIINFPFPPIDAKTHIRLLKPCERNPNPDAASEPRQHSYTFHTIPLKTLAQTSYKILSHEPCRGSSTEKAIIRINNAPFTICKRLLDFLSTLQQRDTINADDLLFIDEICVNPANSTERHAYALNTGLLIRRAAEVAVWFGEPSVTHRDGLKKLADSIAAGTQARCEIPLGRGQLYWICVRAVSEVLLARRLTMHYAGDGLVFSREVIEERILGFPPWCLKSGKVISERATEYGMCAGEGCLDEQMVSRRMRAMLRSEEVDPLAQGSEVLTLEEMAAALASGPGTVIAAYGGETPYALREIYSIRPFPSVAEDPRERLYGILGVLHERTRSRIIVDYSQDVSAVFRQALEAGIHEICDDIAADSLCFDDDECGGAVSLQSRQVSATIQYETGGSSMCTFGGRHGARSLGGGREARGDPGYTRGSRQKGIGEGLGDLLQALKERARQIAQLGGGGHGYWRQLGPQNPREGGDGGAIRMRQGARTPDPTRTDVVSDGACR